jgi:hypothetical protein
MLRKLELKQLAQQGVTQVLGRKPTFRTLVLLINEEHLDYPTNGLGREASLHPQD